MKSFEDEWRARFERFAERHQADHRISGWSDQGLLRRLSLFNQFLKELNLPSTAKILDLGCGAGTYVRLLAGMGYHVIGLDYSLPTLYRAVVADTKRAGHYIGAEAYYLPFREASFDLVISIGIFQALEFPERVLDGIVRVLRPNGFLLMEFLNSFEIIAMTKAANRWFRGGSLRVRTYSIFQIQEWLTRRGLKPVHRAGVYLPPRRFSFLGKLLDQEWMVRFLETVPGFSLIGAHAFLVLTKRGDPWK